MEKRISRKFKPVINHTHGDKANIFAVISLLYIMIVKLPHRPTTCHDPMHIGYIYRHSPKEFWEKFVWTFWFGECIFFFWNEDRQGTIPYTGVCKPDACMSDRLPLETDTSVYLCNGHCIVQWQSSIQRETSCSWHHLYSCLLKMSIFNQWWSKINDK